MCVLCTLPSTINYSLSMHRYIYDVLDLDVQFSSPVDVHIHDIPHPIISPAVTVLRQPQRQPQRHRVMLRMSCMLYSHRTLPILTATAAIVCTQYKVGSERRCSTVNGQRSVISLADSSIQPECSLPSACQSLIRGISRIKWKLLKQRIIPVTYRRE